MKAADVQKMAKEYLRESMLSGQVKIKKNYNDQTPYTGDSSLSYQAWSKKARAVVPSANQK